VLKATRAHAALGAPDNGVVFLAPQSRNHIPSLVVVGAVGGQLACVAGEDRGPTATSVAPLVAFRGASSVLPMPRSVAFDQAMAPTLFVLRGPMLITCPVAGGQRREDWV